MRRFTLWMLGFLSLPPAYAQIVPPADPHYNLVALRVEFAPDTSRFTTGDGTFAGLEFPLVPKVDPLPHDAEYFRAHLDFLEHYIQTASAGKTTLSTLLIPEIIQLANPMASYSPTGEDSESDAELAKLAALVRDSWTEAERVSTFNPAQLSQGKTALLLFHAGVGRDIKLIGTTLNKTPQDIPSVFINSELLTKSGAGGLTFKGIPVDHSIIIPRTETRIGVNSITDEAYLLELSINGLLAASFMSYLGVPDLFNTETGESVIGPFGLMDPLGIFAYGGLFPPLPSAWTQVAAGWVTPKKIQNPGTYELRAGEVAKVEISQAEYFLLENRVRTPDNRGLVMQIFRNGSIESQTISEVRDDFNRFDVEAFQGGVVTQVNSYDYALPGRDADKNQYNGGILIWHVDERQFSQSVNNDRGRLAVDIEEADGAQDIGFDDNIGSPFDFYFAGNPASVSLPSGRTVPLYENRFGPDTTPDSRTNGGGSSFVILENFSEAGPVMYFSFKKKTNGTVMESSMVSLGGRINAEGSISSAGRYSTVFTGTEVLLPGLGKIHASVRPSFGSGSIESIDAESGMDAIFQRYVIRDQQLNLLNSIALPTQLPVQSPVVHHGTAHYVLFSNTDRSEVIRISKSNQTHSYDMNDRGAGLVAADKDVYVFGQSQAGPLGSSPVWTYRLDHDAGDPVMGRDRTGLWGAIPLPEELILLQPDGSVIQVDASAYFGEDKFSGSLAIADLDQDGILDILTTVGNHAVAFSQGGALLPPFPVQIGSPALSSPLVYESEEGIVVVVAAADGNVYALDLEQGGASVPGFPLSAGHSLRAAPYISSDSLTVVTQEGILRSYQISNVKRILWSQKHGNSQNTGFAALESPPDETSSLLSPVETYNWPNPIRDGSTFFRCMTREDADVSITVVDAAGSLADSFSFTTSAGVPREISWHTDAASGVYYARVKAISVSGTTDSRLIRLAIIR